MKPVSLMNFMIVVFLAAVTFGGMAPSPATAQKLAPQPAPAPAPRPSLGVYDNAGLFDSRRFLRETELLIRKIKADHGVSILVESFSASLTPSLASAWILR